MAHFSVTGIDLKGIAAAVPRNVESNYDYTRLSESELKLLIKTTGVINRRVAPRGVTTSDLCLSASQRLIEELNWNPQDISLLIFISQSRDYYLPSTSAILQNKLGLCQSSMVFDIGLGCSGFVYGLSVASSLLKSTGFKKALVLAGDISSANCCFEDKSTYPLFGDAGVACAIENTGNDSEWHFDLYTDGSGYEAIMIPDGGLRNFVSESSFIKKKHAEGIERTDLHLALNGLDVFNFSISKIPESIKHFNKTLNRSPEDYDYMIMHQANLLMNETIRKKSGFDISRTPYSLANFGNTSSASIGVTMVTELQNTLINNKLSMLVSGFGVGLSWANASITTDSIICPDLIEI